MGWDEHIMLIAHTAHTYGDHLHVVGNTGSNSTKEAVHATQQGFAVGMDASLQINPYYGKTSLTGKDDDTNVTLVLPCMLPPPDERHKRNPSCAPTPRRE
eukprot:3068965-Pyramimonas_sp.AAC.1